MNFYSENDRKKLRLTGWDYSSNGYYFITICTKNQECFFGDVNDSNLYLTEIGNITEKYWQEIPHHFPDSGLDEIEVMPHHVYGIIVIIRKDRSLQKI